MRIEEMDEIIKAGSSPPVRDRFVRTVDDLLDDWNKRQAAKKGFAENSVTGIVEEADKPTPNNLHCIFCGKVIQTKCDCRERSKDGENSHERGTAPDAS